MQVEMTLTLTFNDGTKKSIDNDELIELYRQLQKIVVIHKVEQPISPVTWTSITTSNPTCGQVSTGTPLPQPEIVITNKTTA